VGSCDLGHDPAEGVSAMVEAVRVSRPQKVWALWRGQFHLVCDLPEGGLDPIASLGDDLQQAR
jgi:hypothetical protein